MTYSGDNDDWVAAVRINGLRPHQLIAVACALQKTGAGQNDAFSKLCDMGDEPDRRAFLERLFSFMDEKGTPISIVPAISKQPVDLYRLYHVVREKGGLVEVTKSKKWRDVSGALNIGASSSAGFTLRKNYTKYIFPYECRFDLGNADPNPILASLETPSKKESKRAQQQAAAAAAAAGEPRVIVPLTSGISSLTPSLLSLQLKTRTRTVGRWGPRAHPMAATATSLGPTR